MKIKWIYLNIFLPVLEWILQMWCFLGITIFIDIQDTEEMQMEFVILHVVSQKLF